MGAAGSGDSVGQRVGAVGEGDCCCLLQGSWVVGSLCTTRVSTWFRLSIGVLVSVEVGVWI